MALNIGADLSETKMNELQFNARQISSSRGLEQACKYVNNYFNGYKDVLLKKGYFTAKFESVIT